MTIRSVHSSRMNRRTLLKGSAALGLGAAVMTKARPARAAGGRVIIGAFADGGLAPFKEKIIPLAKQEGGFEIEYLEEEYGVTLEKWFADARNCAGKYDVYVVGSRWATQLCA